MPLFESLLAFENYPVDPSLAGLDGAPRVSSLGIRETTNYPLLLVAAAPVPTSTCASSTTRTVSIRRPSSGSRTTSVGSSRDSSPRRTRGSGR